MRVVFINYWDFSTPSAMHIFHCANALAKLKIECIVYGFNGPVQSSQYGKAKFANYSYPQTSPALLAQLLRTTPQPTIVHCWTPRECARFLATPLAQFLRAPLVIHLEDNEEVVFEEYAKMLPAGEVDKPTAWRIGQPLFSFSHPVFYQQFLAQAHGITTIIEELKEFAPAHVPQLTFWPACEPEVFLTPPQVSDSAKQAIGVPANSFTLFYPGNVHPANLQEVIQLYMAVALLNKKNIPTYIIKFGNYFADFIDGLFEKFAMPNHCIDLSEKITPAQIPDMLAATDFLVQPGTANNFNDYRFPCKLPLFLASGRPVILPKSNIGLRLTDMENCLHTSTGSAQEIVSKIEWLIENPTQAQTIGQAGQAFAREHFSWATSAQKLLDFYQQLLKK